MLVDVLIAFGLLVVLDYAVIKVIDWFGGPRQSNINPDPPEWNSRPTVNPPPPPPSSKKVL